MMVVVEFHMERNVLKGREWTGLNHIKTSLLSPLETFSVESQEVESCNS